MSLIRNKTYHAAMHNSVELGRALQRLLWSKSIEHGSFGFEFAVSYVLFLRVERSLASIRSLVRLGLTDDAMALVRVMVEKIITAEYILLVGMEPAMDFIQFLAFSEWRNYQELQATNPWLAPSYTAKQLRELEAAHDKAKTKVLPSGSVKMRYGRGHDWTELSLAKRAEKVDLLLKERRFTASTRTMFDASYKKSAAYLHGSFASIARSIETQSGKDETLSDAELQSIEVGFRVRDKAPRLGVDALQTANAAAFQMLGFLAEVLQHKKSREWAYAFARKMVKRPQVEATPGPDQN
jgi:hypothetical protein